ncbi:MAG: HEAT repeat domain-containing protein [Chloroflexota bacterium]
MTTASEPSKEDRIALLRQIVESPDFTPARRRIIRKHVADPEPEVRMVAIEGLWDYPESEFVPLLFHIAQNDPDEMVRCRAIVTLGRFVYEGEMAQYDFDFGPIDELARADELPHEDYLKVRTFLLALYRDESKTLDERRFAVEALSFCTDEQVTDIISQAYAHADPKMKLSAIFAMGRNGGVRWSETLIKELHNPDPDLQREAIRAAGEAGLTEAGKELWRLTYSDDREIMLEAIWALGQSGWEGAFERLDELSLEGADDEIRETAEAALEEWQINSGALADEMFDENGLDWDDDFESFVGEDDDW